LVLSFRSPLSKSLKLYTHHGKDVGVRGPDIGEGAASSESPAELGRIIDGPTGVGVAETGLFLGKEVVGIQTKLHAGAFLDAPPFGKRELGPVQAGTFERVAAQAPWREGRRVSEGIEFQVRIL